MRMSNFFLLMGWVALGFFGVQAYSVMTKAAPGDADVQEEATIKKIARTRSYAGGVDEEPLKVQSQLPAIKKEGQNEAEAPEPADAD